MECARRLADHFGRRGRLLRFEKLAYYFLQNVQKNVCLLINDPVDGAYPLVAVNDTRLPAEGTVTVTDVATGKEVFKGSYNVGPNGRQCVSNLPVMKGQGMLQIRYDANGENCSNHFLYGEPPYKARKSTRDGSTRRKFIRTKINSGRLT